MKYGLKEVADVIFFDYETGEPELVFDTLKVSTIENEAESAEARGGQSNGSLVRWDFGRSATLALQDALLSDDSLAALSGSSVETGNYDATQREVLTVVEVAGSKQVTLSKPRSMNVITSELKTAHAYLGTEGLKTKLAVDATNSDATTLVFASTATVAAGDIVTVIYETTILAAKKITFSSKKFPKVYRVVGSSLVRSRDGKDYAAQFVVYKAKLQPNFSLTMDAENVSTFDFNLEMLETGTTGNLYDFIRFE